MIRSALEDLDLAAVFAELRNQESNGHTAESDADLPLEAFDHRARRLAGELGDVLLRGDRQNLEVAYRRAARLADYAIATQRRIRLEQRRRAPCNMGEEGQ